MNPEDASNQHPDLVRKKVEPDEITVGEYPQQSWREKLGNLFKNKKTIVAGAAATAATLTAATGTADNVAHAAKDVIEAPINAIESVLPNVSSEFTTPKEVLDGSVDIRINEELKARKDPNTESGSMDWKDLKLVTSDYDPEKNMNVENLIDLSESEGFSIDNPLIVLAGNPDGGARPGRWLKLQAEKDGDRFDVYVSLSSQTSEFIDQHGSDYIGIKSQKTDDKTTAYLPENSGDELPNGQFNHIRELNPPPSQPQE